jgi:hypothetical protein
VIPAAIYEPIIRRNNVVKDGFVVSDSAMGRERTPLMMPRRSREKWCRESSEESSNADRGKSPNRGEATVVGKLALMLRRVLLLAHRKAV